MSCNCSVFGCNLPAKYNYLGKTPYCEKHYRNMSLYQQPFGDQTFLCKYYLPDPRYPDDCCAMKTGTGEIITFDLEDLWWIQYYNWSCGTSHMYATTTIAGNIITMHRLIYLKEKYNSAEYINLQVDHKNNNSHDNRKANLRLATPKENTVNRYASNIYFRDNKYHVIFVSDGKELKYGKFESYEDALAARDNALDELRGEFNYFKYTDTSIYDRKVKLVYEYDQMIEDMKKNDPAKIKPAFYINDRKTYMEDQRRYFNLPEPKTNDLVKKDIKCCVCGAQSVKKYKGYHYCQKHFASLFRYNQPFGKAKFENNIRNLRFKNFNNTGISVLVTFTNDIVIFDAEYSDLIFRYNWRRNNNTGNSSRTSTIVTTDNESIDSRGCIPMARLLFSKKHPEILEMKSSLCQVEYKNGNPLDLRMDNLICNKFTPIGRGVAKSVSKRPENNEFRGVSYDPKENSYRAYLTCYGNVIRLGRHKTFEGAIEARLAGERQYFGETFEDIMESNIIYEEMKKQIENHLNSMDPDIESHIPYYITTEDPGNPMFNNYFNGMREYMKYNALNYMVNNIHNNFEDSQYYYLYH